MSVKPYMVLDVETTGLDWTRDMLHGIGVGYSDGSTQYYPAWQIPVEIITLIEDPGIDKIGHNLHGFDAKFIKKFGINIQGEFHDTMILANLYDSDMPLGLKYLAEKYIGAESIEDKRELDRYISLNGAGNVAGLCARDLADSTHPHTDTIAQYCKEDVRNTQALYELFLDKLKVMDEVLRGPKYGFTKTPLNYYYEEALPLERVLFDIEYRGIRINMAEVNKARDTAVMKIQEIEDLLTKKFSNRIPKVEEKLHARAVAKLTKPAAKAKLKPGEGKLKFAWQNSNHVGELLYEHSDLPSEVVQRTAKGRYRTDKIALENIVAGIPDKHPVKKALEVFAAYKLHLKIASTYTGTAKKGIMSKIRYLDGVPRIFPTYRQTTGTGRLACKNPNMQNIKRDSDVKKFFIPDTDTEVFDDADYSQIELRVGAALSKDPGLMNAYLEGLDVHLQTASKLYGRVITKADDVERQAGKRTNFLTIFDGGPYRLQTTLRTDTGKEFSIEQCKQFLKIWFDTYPQVRHYLDEQLEFFKKHKFCISLAGRVRRLPDITFGVYIKWVMSKETNKWVPNYFGPRRQELIEELLKGNPNVRITDEAVGRLANKKYSHAIKAGYNQPIQGLAASFTKRSMIELAKQGRKIVNQVHDSLIVSREADNILEKQALISIMENIYNLGLPLTVDVKTLRSFHSKDKV